MSSLALAKQVGITMGGSFIFGTPTETFEEMNETMKWCWENDNLCFFGINILTPYPGTAVWKDCQAFGLIPEDINYERLIPPRYPNESMLVVSTLPRKKFLRYVIDFHRLGWIHSQVRCNPSLKTFFGLAIAPSWWYLWLKYPKPVFRLMCYAYRMGKQ